jgi:hypothetical protein
MRLTMEKGLIIWQDILLLFGETTTLEIHKKSTPRPASQKQQNTALNCTLKI